MTYIKYTKLPFRQSPNYTPGSQTLAIYGRPRVISFGAGHWWNRPEAKPSFSGVVATLCNPARQASANTVLSDRRVQEIVRAADTSWATNQANPFTFSIEVDPQIMYKWWAGGDKAKAQRIFDTLVSYIADKGYHNLPWKPHKYWHQTECNPIPWGEVMTAAKKAYAQKHATPTPSVKWVKMDDPRKLVARVNLKVVNVTTGKTVGDTIKAGTKIDFNNKTTYKGKTYLRSNYSTSKHLNTGIERSKLKEVPAPKPEWQVNLKNIEPVKLMVLPAQTPIVDLNTGNTIKQLGKGTWVDFTKSTIVKGVAYLISSYSATNAMPNGIKKADVGIPAEPPKAEKPEWLENWRDIEDVVMYARADTDLVNFEDGKTISVIARGTAIDVASTTEYFGHKYAITKYSTERKDWRGIRLDDLDADPITDDNAPAEPAPEQPEITEQQKSAIMAAIEAFVATIKTILGIK